jgi:uncharacterized lipoprotein
MDSQIPISVTQAGLALALVALTGCTTILPLNYAPTSKLSASGSVRVADFQYLPALAGRVKPNQIRNTALDNLIFDQEIGAFYRDAVLKELGFVGVKTESGTRTLTGDVREFLIDDLGANVDWTLRVLYRVSEREKSVYESEKITQRRTAKFGDPFATMNETLKLNIEEIIKDPAFLKAINDS